MLGTNLAKISYYSTQHPFVNEFKSSRPWFTQGNRVWNTQHEQSLNLTDDGWIESVGDELKDGDRIATLLYRKDSDYPQGRYIVSYEGEGSIKYGLDARKIEDLSVPGRDVIEVNPTGAGVLLSIPISSLKSGSDNNIRDIEIIPPGVHERQGMFNPEFIEKLQPFDTIRFMDWMNTNNSTQKQWSDRPLLDDARYSEGVPVEIMVELANQTNASSWFNMPHEANNEYIENFARYVKDNLNPNLNVYVEYSNEVWNSMFEQTKWAREQADDSKDDSNLIDWYSQRTVEVIEIWDDVFESSDSVIGVMASQAANVLRGEKLLDYRWSDESLDHNDTGVDAIAIAPYFGNYIGRPENQDVLTGWGSDLDKGLDNLFDELTQGGLLANSPEGGALNAAYRNIEAYSQLATEHDLRLLAYEGGQHLAGSKGVENSEEVTDLFIEANRDPRMGEIMSEYLDKWYELGGDTFVNFTDVRAHNKWGSWGALESVYQDSSPKYDALAD